MENTEKRIRKFKGTKGTWKYNKNGQYIEVRREEDHKDGRFLCVDVFLFESHEGNSSIKNMHLSSESIANAKLISAAPDLLEALTLLVSSITETRIEGQLGKELGKAEAAIKKATS